MDFYFINWRKAYHDGRTTYHQAMSRFYAGQNEAMELWFKMTLEMYKSMMGVMTLKYLRLADRPLTTSDFFGKWT